MVYTHINKYFAKVKQHLLICCVLALIISCHTKETENPDHTVLAGNILEHAYQMVNNGQARQAVHYLDSAYQNFPNPGPIDLLRKYNLKATYYLSYEIDTAKARVYADSMLYVLKGKEQDHKIEYTNAVFTKGDVLMAEKRYAEAFKHYYDGKTFARKYFDSCQLCGFSYRLALVRYHQGQYQKAIPYLKQSLSENASCNSSTGFESLFFSPQTYLNTTALCFERLGQLDSAIYYYKRTLTFINKNAGHYPDMKQFMESARAVVYGNMGGVYAAMNNYDKAEQYLKQSIKINDQPGFDKNDAQTAKIKLADLYLRFSHLTEADTVIKKIQTDFIAQKAQRNVMEDSYLKFYRLKWTFFDKIHMIDSAYVYQQKYYKLNDSIDQVKKELTGTDMDVAFKNNEQQHKLSLLSRDNKLKTIYLLSIIIVSLMAIAILLIVWFSLKRSRKNVVELTKLNQLVKDHNTQMQHALTALEQSQEDNNRIMKMVVHDLRSPISSTISITSLLLDTGNHTDEDKDLLQLMKTSNMQSIDMITDLLNMNTRAESLKKELVKMDVLLKHCVDMLKFKAAEKKQSISLVTEEVSILADREKIWRVVSNLIVNAIKFSSEGADIAVSLHRQDNNVQILVQDHGIGIPDGFKDKIFTTFAGVRRPGTSGEESFGLGLAIARQIVEAHSGKIWVESEPGKDTTFFVELPAG